MDYRLAFVGGLDLCFGYNKGATDIRYKMLCLHIFNRRYDTQRHSLTDPLSHDEIFPGQDYSNPRIKDFYKGNKIEVVLTSYLLLYFFIVSQYDMELIDKKCTARMPWHDIHTAMVKYI